MPRKLKGLTYRQSFAFNTIRFLENELIKGLSYTTVKDAEDKIMKIEALIQQHFPQDWDKFLIRRAVKITPMPDQSNGEVEELFAEMAS